MLREIRVSLDPVLEAPPALAPLIDPNVHSCGTVPPHGVAELAHPEPGFYIVGSKSYGRAPTFLMLTGYEQVRSVVAEIAGDHEAARDVRLVLPETGVCNTSSTGCCGGPAPAEADACCVKDADAKAAGLAGCGCGSTETNAAEPVTLTFAGYEPVRSVAVQLVGGDKLPQAQPLVFAAANAYSSPATGCCGGPAPAGADACCVQDAEAKAAGQSGCGCGSTVTNTSAPVASAGGCCGR
jgi:hypothetical protein